MTREYQWYSVRNRSYGRHKICILLSLPGDPSPKSLPGTLCAQLWTASGCPGSSGTQKEAGALWCSTAQQSWSWATWTSETKRDRRNSDTYQQNTGLWWLSLQVCVVWDWDSDNLLPEDTTSSFRSKFLQRMSFTGLCCSLYTGCISHPKYNLRYWLQQYLIASSSSTCLFLCT